MCKKNYTQIIFNPKNEDPIFECVRQKTKTKNCLYLTDKSQGYCVECKLGYYMDDYGKCVKSRSYDMDYFSYSYLLRIMLVLLI